MAGKFGEIVAYNDGERDIPAIVQAAAEPTRTAVSVKPGLSRGTT